MTGEPLDRIAARLDRLEHAYWRWRFTALAILAIVLLAGLAGASAARSVKSPSESPPAALAVATEIRAKRFLLVDDAGKVRAFLGTATRGAVSLGLLDSTDKLRSILTVGADGVPRLEMLGPDETRRAVLGVYSNRSGLALFGDAARGGAILDVAADGTATLGFTDKDERTRVGLVLRADGTALLSFNDATERTRAALGAGSDGGPGLGMWDGDGKRIWQAPAAEGRP